MSSVTIEKTQDVNTNLELTNTYGKERDFKTCCIEITNTYGKERDFKTCCI